MSLATFQLQANDGPEALFVDAPDQKDHPMPQQSDRVETKSVRGWRVRC